MKTYVTEAHKNGIKLLTYVNNAFWGKGAWETLREHPDWALYTGDGQWYARFDFEETGGLPGVVPEDLHKYSACYINFTDLRVVDAGIQALVAGMQMFDYDGARWDGQWLVSGDYGTSDYFDFHGRLNPRSAEADDIGARNYRRVKEQLRKARSEFIFGFNYGVRFREGPATIPKTYAETIGERGWVLWETARGMMQGVYPGLETWQRVGAAIREETTAARGVGGEMFMHVDSGSSVYNSYLCALAFANRAHISNPTDLGHWYRFAIRYGGLLYDPFLEPTRATGINVQAEAPLWWEQTIYRRKLSARREQLIIHLINPPADEKVNPKEGKVPAARANVRVSAPVPTGSRLVSAWALSPDPDTHGEALTPSLANGLATVNVPELRFWDVVVLEFENEEK